MPKLKTLERKTYEHGQMTHAFYCPGCKGVHGVSSDIWTISGTPESPTIRASVLVHPWTSEMEGVPSQPLCHSFVTDGRIEFLSDSTHELAGQTVDLPDFDDWFK